MALKLKKNHSSYMMKQCWNPHKHFHMAIIESYIKKIVNRVAIMGTCMLPWLEISDQSFS